MGIHYLRPDSVLSVVPTCHYSTKNLWRSIRHNFLTSTGHEILGSPLPARPAVKDLVLVVLDRSNQGERALVGQAELVQLIREEIRPRELVVFTRETLPRTIEIFHRAHIILGVHGAGLSNMVFVRKGAVVVEIQPEEYTNYCFYLLARTLGFPHLLVPGGGHKATPTTVDPQDVIGALKKATQLLEWIED